MAALPDRISSRQSRRLPYKDFAGAYGKLIPLFRLCLDSAFILMKIKESKEWSHERAGHWRSRIHRQSHCKVSNRKGYDVTVVDDLSRGNAGLLPLEAHFYPIDILTPQFQEFMAARHFDAVIHWPPKLKLLLRNEIRCGMPPLILVGPLAVLEGARKAHVSRFVFASSAAVYGHPSEALLPLAEEAPLCPLSPYGLSKVTAENYIRMLAPSFLWMGDSSLCQCIWRAGSP